MIYIKNLEYPSAVISDLDLSKGTHCLSLTFQFCSHTSFLILMPAITSASIQHRAEHVLHLSLISNSAESSGCFSFQFSVFSSYHSGSGGGLLALKPMLLIPDDTAATPSAVSSLRSGNLSRKRRREKQSWWGLGRRLATRLKHGTENGSCQEMWRWGRAGEVRPPPPTDALFCLKTLSHELDTPGHQIKCRQASLSSWVRRYVCAWTQVWLLR